MRRLVAIGLVAFVVYMLAVAPVMACEGNTPGYWKNPKREWPEGYYIYFRDPVTGDLIPPYWELIPLSRNTPIQDIFNVPMVLYGDTLLDALGYHGGDSLLGATRILLRAAAAGILNCGDPNTNYLLDGLGSNDDGQILIDMVNTALATNNRGTILDLAVTLDEWNNL